MYRLAVLCVIALSGASVGCTYLRDRGNDLADVFRLEMSVGVGIQASAMVTDAAHVGIGSSDRYTAGLMYGDLTSQHREEHYLPLSYIHTIMEPEYEAVHTLSWSGEGPAPDHRCYMIVPGRSPARRHSWTHWFDIEVSAFAGIVGVEAGFSPGELIDFVAGLFWLDPAQDDGPENRARSRVWQRRPESVTDPQRGP